MKRATHELHTRCAMVLRAGAAVNAFCRKRQLSRISNGAAGEQTRVRRWTPVLLRWARKGARAQAGTPVRGPTVSSWVSHFHLHFHIATMLASGRVRDGAAHDRERVGIYTPWFLWATAGSGRAEPGLTVETSGATEASRLIAAARRRGLRASRELLMSADRTNAAGLFGNIRTATARRASRRGISSDASRWPSAHLEQIWNRRASRPSVSRRNAPGDTHSFAVVNRGESGYARESARTVREGTGERIARARRRGLRANRELLMFADRANAAGFFGNTGTTTARRAGRSGISSDASRWPSVHLEQIWNRRASRPGVSPRNALGDTHSFAAVNHGASSYARESARTVREGTGERIARARHRSTFNAAIQSGGLTHERDSGAHISLASTRSRRLFRASSMPLQNIWCTPSEEGARTTSASRRLPDWVASRSVDLVWRASADAAASGAAPRAAMSYSAPSMNAPSTSTSPPAAAGRSRDTAVVCATALDPALANRLADDVIRRIDRRARIERERRGL
jgi:hypothetical protein